jgi:UDP-N-acetylglucosamine--N-acetylmuramyl-(pentapeptide) pyrophosphoryl-undecaprenol N-acetylglucosamine transferase
LRADGWEVVWLGTASGLEARIVPQNGLTLETVQVSALRGKGWRTLLVAPFRLVGALRQALRIIRRVRPAAVLGMGGYATGPGGIAAWICRRPLLVHEQNAVAGLTNRILARVARRVLTGFPDALPRGEWCGNPVREDISMLPPPETRMADRSGPLRVLVLGGSQGARVLNTVVPSAIAALADDERPQVRHQCGERLYEEAVASWREAGVDVAPEPFIEDMAAAYAWADLVICRAGALTVAELAAAGVGAILVPYPSAVDDHQTHNGRFLSDAGAAELVPQQELDGARLVSTLRRLTGERGQIVAMAKAARALARPRATALVAEACVAAAEVAA